jgi:hypothetical protein
MTMYGFVSESGAQSAADVWQAPRGSATHTFWRCSRGDEAEPDRGRDHVDGFGDGSLRGRGRDHKGHGHDAVGNVGNLIIHEQPDPDDRPEGAACSRHLAYMTASHNALRKPRALGQDIPLNADYTKYSFDPERSEFSAFIYQLSSQGLKMAGDPGLPRPKVRSIDLVAKPFPIVVLTDCPTPAVKWDAHDVKTGKNAAVPPPAGTVPPPYRTTVQVINYKNHWGVAKITTDSGRTCSG